MIHIHYPKDKRPPEEWLTKAHALTVALRDAPDKTTRHKIIDENARFWGEIKEWLEQFSYGKCWFSEARDTCSYWQVEHFRPKKAKASERDGYWWLAFDYLNYRLCGSVVNAKKGSFFPLKPGSVPATSPEDDCDDEANVLIDPIRKSDVDLITFTNGGIAVPSEPEGWNRERAEKSIERYGLNEHPALNRARAAVWNRCEVLLNELERLIVEQKKADQMERQHSPSRKIKIEQHMRDLQRMTLPTAEFSAVARAFLFQDKRLWANRLVT
jgi:hypothetical protein